MGFFFVSLLLFSCCTNPSNEPAVKEWKEFNGRILNSDAITGITWELAKLYEVKDNLSDLESVIYEAKAMQYKKAEEKLNKAMSEIPLRSHEVTKVIYFLKGKQINRSVIDKYETVLTINKQALKMAELVNNCFSNLKDNIGKIDVVQQKDLNELQTKLSVLKVEINRFLADWLTFSRSNPGYVHTLISKTFPDYFKSSIRAYGATKFYKEVDSCIENGEMIIAKIVKIKTSSGKWASRDDLFRNEPDFYAWHYSAESNSFSIWRSIDLLGPNKFILRYIYVASEKNIWYLEFLEKRKSSLIKKSLTVEKYEFIRKQKGVKL
jgi:hypothetical protein